MQRQTAKDSNNNNDSKKPEGSHLSNYSLILHWVEGAGRVHEATTNFQHLTSMQSNAQLQRVQAIAIAWGPAPPDVRSLANGAITAAGYVTQDAVKQNRLLQQQVDFVNT